MSVSIFQTKEIKFLPTVYDVQFLQSEHMDLKLRGCDWRFSIEKVSNDDGIHVHLERIFTAGDHSYTFIASAKVELKSYDERVPSHIGHISPKEYSMLHRKWSLEPFIEWDQLINPAKRFIDDNQIQLEVTVKVDEPRKPDENRLVDVHVFTGIDKSEMKLRLIFTKIAKVPAALSNEFSMFGLPMRIQIYKNDKFDDEQGIGSLCVYMWNWRNSDDGDVPQKLKFESKFKLLAYGKEEKAWLPPDSPMTYERNSGTREIGHDADWIGFEHFISWQHLTITHMSPAGAIQMEVDIKEVNIIDLKRSSEDSDAPVASTSTESANESLNRSNSLVKCSRCSDDMLSQTLLRVECGHLYCNQCIDQDLKILRRCVVCNEELDLNLPPQIILFD